MAQRAVDRERIGRDVRLEPLGEHHLIDVAGGDVLLALANLLLVLIAGAVRPHLEGRPVVRPRRHREIALELALEELNLGARELVQRLEVVVGGDARVGDDQDAVLDVVEREHGVEHHEAGLIGSIGRVADVAEHRLEPGCCAVSEVTDRAAGESGQIGDEGRPEVGHQLAQRLDERTIAVGDGAVALERGMAVARPQNQERVLAEERIAPDVLAAFDALQQERVIGVLGDLQERRHRRQQIGDDLLADRDKRAAPRQFREFFKRRDFHRR